MMSRQNRREFTKTALAAAVLAGAGVDGGAAQATPEPNAAAGQALMDIARLRFGKHVSEEQFRKLRRKILAGLRAAERLQRVRPGAGAEPAFIFQADVQPC